MKYQLPVSLEVSVRTGAGEGLVWQRELKTLQGRTSSKHAKVVTDYAKSLATRLNGKGDEAVVLPVLGYYGTVRMWNDSSLLKGGDIDLSRASGYIECLEPSGSYNTFGQWFRYATESALEYDHLIRERGLQSANPYRQILGAVKRPSSPVSAVWAGRTSSIAFPPKTCWSATPRRACSPWKP